MTIKWKIGKKPRGLWRAPFYFRISYDNVEMLNLRPHFKFQNKYALPAPIYLGLEKVDTSKYDGSYCKKIEEINIDIDQIIDSPQVLHTKIPLYSKICLCSCKACQAFLEWRKIPDYSDYYEIFTSMARDLMLAWNDAIQEATTSEEYESEEVIISSSDIIKKEMENKPIIRKLNIGG